MRVADRISTEAVAIVADQLPVGTGTETPDIDSGLAVGGSLRSVMLTVAR